MCYFVQRNMCFCTYQCLGSLAHLRKPTVSTILFVQTWQTTKPVSCDMCFGTVHLFGLFVLMLPIWLWSSVSVLGCNMWLVLLSVVVRHRSPIYVYICCFWLRGGWEGFDSPSSCLLLAHAARSLHFWWPRSERTYSIGACQQLSVHILFA